MDPAQQDAVARLPDEMLRFILQTGSHGARYGQLLSHGHTPIHTPHYVATTSRGVIPHLAQDVLTRHTAISTVYFGQEDFIEKSTSDAAIYNTPFKPGESRLRRYTALPTRLTTILGARRVPRIQCPAQNTHDGISISTSVGFRSLKAEEYDTAVQTLGADVSVGLPDLVDKDVVSKKRVERSIDRVHGWLRDSIASSSSAEEQPDIEGQLKPTLFASIMPHEAEVQNLYLSDLVNEYRSQLSGLCVYEPETVTVIPHELDDMTRLCISNPETPQAILHAISLGIDLITVPFVTAISERGLAFDFTFPVSSIPTASCSRAQHEDTSPPSNSKPPRLPLSLELWSPVHASTTTPLTPSCSCYTCTRHHRAYIHHLLTAKEMLAWTLLQVHNFHVLDSFFDGVRNSIQAGSFEQEKKRFEDVYEADWREGLGKDKGPRVRGYQVKSRGKGQDVRRERAWGRFEGSVTPEIEEAEGGNAMPGDGPIGGMEVLGLAEKEEDVKPSQERCM